jgi:guanosine-3',5'-bis(diphosphate) 3'-pyrophosphohydrolase
LVYQYGKLSSTLEHTMNREAFFRTIAGLPSHELLRVQSAYWLSKDVHRKQIRDTGERYFNHPRRVAYHLIDMGYTNSDGLILALLHDAIEDTNVPFCVITGAFGAATWQNLFILSKSTPSCDPITGETIGHIKKDTEVYYKRIMEADKHVRLVKLADRLDNLEDMVSFTPERKAKYIAETEKYVIPLAESTCHNFLNRIIRVMNGKT